MRYPVFQISGINQSEDWVQAWQEKQEQHCKTEAEFCEIFVGLSFFLFHRFISIFWLHCIFFYPTKQISIIYIRRMSLLDDYGSSSERKVNFLFVKKCFLYGVDKPTNGIRSLCLKLNYIESYNDRNIPSEVDFVCQHSVVSLLLLIYT